MSQLGIKNCCRGWGKGLAFTLAEVLITLGIIGVVAALTLPNLVANYKKQVLVTQLKAEVNIIENSFRKILANEGVDVLNNTPLFNELGFNKDYYISQTGFSEIPYDSEMKFVQEIKEKSRSNPYPIFYINNGGCFAVKTTGYIVGVYKHPEVYVDVNCDKSPNRLGYDQFMIYFDGMGKLVVSPLYDQMCVGLVNTSQMSINHYYGDYVGRACFDKIVRDGWKINY